MTDPASPWILDAISPSRLGVVVVSGANDFSAQGDIINARQ
jgi:hypothetical protein